MPPTIRKPYSEMSSTYDRVCARAASSPRADHPGHPPTTSLLTTAGKSIRDSGRSCGGPSKSPLNETAPVACPVSANVMVRIRMCRKRPAPECRSGSRSGLAEPARMNCPGRFRSSTAWRASFQRPGTSCHSSSRRGASPGSAVAGCSRANSARGSAESSLSSDAARRRADSVVPAARAPWTSSAPANSESPPTRHPRRGVDSSPHTEPVRTQWISPLHPDGLLHQRLRSFSIRTVRRPLRPR